MTTQHVKYRYCTIRRYSDNLNGQELTSIHASRVYLYICLSLFGPSTFFVASLVFMKGTSCCVIRRNFKQS